MTQFGCLKIHLIIKDVDEELMLAFLIELTVTLGYTAFYLITVNWVDEVKSSLIV